MNPDYALTSTFVCTLLASFQITCLLSFISVSYFIWLSTLMQGSRDYPRSHVFKEMLNILAGPSRGAHWGGERVNSTMFLVFV